MYILTSPDPLILIRMRYIKYDLEYEIAIRTSKITLYYTIRVKNYMFLGIY